MCRSVFIILFCRNHVENFGFVVLALAEHDMPWHGMPWRPNALSISRSCGPTCSQHLSIALVHRCRRRSLARSLACHHAKKYLVLDDDTSERWGKATLSFTSSWLRSLVSERASKRSRPTSHVCSVQLPCSHELHQELSCFLPISPTRSD